MGPQSSDKCPFKRHTGERPSEVFLIEEEAGGVQSLAKEHLEPPEARRGKKETLQEHLEGVCSC